MTLDYRQRLFTTYQRTHVDFVEQDEPAKLVWFGYYARLNYLRHLVDIPMDAPILEIGCNKGYLLAALGDLGYRNLTGLDLSPADIERAKELAPHAQVLCADAYPYLEERPGQFRVILLKAVLEHVPKADILPFLEAIKRGLAPGGLVLIDVPNMDWLFASHERFMDFTHEAGFTRESLGQVLRNVFGDAQVFRGEQLIVTGLKTRLVAWRRRMVVGMLNRILRILGEGADDVWWDTRSIIGVGRYDGSH